MNHKVQQPINRRDFLKITAIAGLTIGAGATILDYLQSLDNPVRVEETHYLMGTIVNFTVIAPNQKHGSDALRQTVREMERLISIFDYRTSGAALQKLNRDGFIEDTPIELLDLLKFCLSLGDRTHGAFDITVLPVLQAFKEGLPDIDPLKALVDYKKVVIEDHQVVFAQPNMAVTLDGIAKGRVVDHAVHVLKTMGYENVLVEAGGDLMAAADQSTPDWQIAVQNPRPSEEKQILAVFSVRNQAVTTSGDYLNHFSTDYFRHHIIDPRTGNSPAELASATVIAANATEADAYSTALMVMGVQEGMEFINQIPGAHALMVTRDLHIHKTPNFPKTYSS